MTTPYNAYRVDVINPSTLVVTEITNVQEVSVSVGRRLSTGQWSSSSCSITARYPTGYNSPISDLGPDSIVRVWGPGRYPDGLPTWIGYVQDCAPTWGIPWNTTSNRGEADLLTITGEGQLAHLSRGVYSIAAQTDVAMTYFRDFGPTDFGFKYNVWTSSNGLQTTNARATWSTTEWNLGNMLQRASQTVDGKLIDGVCYWYGLTSTDIKTKPAIYFGTQSDNSIPTVRFSDTTNNATNRKYDQLQFGGLADNYYDGANVDPDAVASVTYPTTPARQISYSTLNTSTTTATDLAKCLATQYGTRPTTPAPIMISAIASAQHTDNLDSLGLTRDSDAIELALLCRAKIEIVFRGTTHYANIEGVTLTATPDDTRFTYYLTPRAYADWLIMDNSTYGKLDTGRLAFA